MSSCQPLGILLSPKLLGLALALLTWSQSVVKSAHAQIHHHAPCSPPTLGDVPGHCRALDHLCVDHAGILISHDQLHAVENIRRQEVPDFAPLSWNLPGRVNILPDALVGRQPDYKVRVRPAGKAEPTHALKHPLWSNCTVPVILLGDYIHNYRTFLSNVVADVDSLLRVKGMVQDRAATLVVATPGGLPLEPHHAALLQPYSDRPVVSLAEVGRRGQDGESVSWTGERRRLQCFVKAVVCRLGGNEGHPAPTAAAALWESMAPDAPADPLGFAPAATPPGAPLAEDTTLRVVVERRSAGWRAIRSVEEILRACEEANAQGFSAGPFTRIACRALPYGYDPNALPALGTISAHSSAVVELRRSIAAVRSAHVLVATHGSVTGHAFFMAGGAGTALLEVRPCGFGTRWAEVANGGRDTAADQLRRADDAIRFFAYNLEDPGQCAPPDYAPLADRAAQHAAAHPPKEGEPQRLAPRHPREALLARDQHVSPRPAQLLAMVRQVVAPLLRAEVAAYRAAREAGRTHAYVVAEGLVLGRPGVADVAAHRAGGAEFIAAA